VVNASLQRWVEPEETRRSEFPVAAGGVFLAHAGVAPLPRAAADALRRFADFGSRDNQETSDVWLEVAEARRTAARLIGAQPHEIALLGPTALGLNLVAHGLDWAAGDEVVYYPDDYPANVYPWLALAGRGVRPVPLRPERPGALDWPVVEAALTPRTRLVSLASCHYLSGYRIDVDAIGGRLHERGILFCLDAIQSLGAFPLLVEHVDFLAADSHKWLLGPVGAGLFYVRASRQEQLRPTLLGAWNVRSPHFVAQPEIALEEGARRYEPGSLNIPGVLGMSASLRLLLEAGVPAISARILERADALRAGLARAGFQLYGPDGVRRSGIVSVYHPDRDLPAVFQALQAAGIRASLRRDRAGRDLLRFSPHFYNTSAEIDRVLAALETTRLT
jgi:cysteine desulfurase/selenocysteine lyase